MLPGGTRAVVDLSSWHPPRVFDWLQSAGGVSGSEMLRTFNCGVGMVLCVPATEARRACELLNGAGEQAWSIGRVEAAPGEARVVYTGGALA